MAASTSSICSPFLASPRPFSLGSTRSKDAILLNRRIRSPSSRTTAFAMRRSEADHHHDDHHYSSGSSSSSGKIVDENMIVLRKRIHEMNMIEKNYEPPSEWMEWEKGYYTNYDSMICEAMGLLQSYLMNSRPSFAVGMIALVALSVPTSTFVVMSQLMELTKIVLSGIHLS